MRFSKLFKLRNDLSALVLHTHFGESIHSQEKSPFYRTELDFLFAHSDEKVTVIKCLQTPTLTFTYARS